MLQISGVAKHIKKTQILYNVTFEAKPGEMAALTGRNGSGKSTLLQIMSGMSVADSGSICYFGHKMENKRKLYAKYCGYLPQTNGLMEELSVQDNISLWTGHSGRPDGRIMELFDLEGLLKKPVRSLSGGMKRRVAVACAMANLPPILLMDEPTAALDREYSKVIHNFMKEYLHANGILIVATHDDREIAMADIRIELRDGVSVVVENGKEN